jgi:hypothetical protein
MPGRTLRERGGAEGPGAARKTRVGMNGRLPGSFTLSRTGLRLHGGPYPRLADVIDICQ